MKTKIIIFKCRISINENEEMKVMSHSNRLIPGGMLNLLNKKVHGAATEWNGKRNWMKTYVHFGYEGVNYKQVDATHLCEGCCFLKDQQKCTHPHFYTKPNCTGKIYVIDK